MKDLRDLKDWTMHDVKPITKAQSRLQEDGPDQKGDQNGDQKGNDEGETKGRRRGDGGETGRDARKLASAGGEEGQYGDDRRSPKSQTQNPKP